MVKDCKLASRSCIAHITGVKGICIYVSEYVCIPKMQLAKFIRLESLKINEKERTLGLKGKLKIQHATYLKGKDKILSRLVSNMTADFSC